MSSSSAKPLFLSSANPFLSSPISVFFLSDFCKPINGNDHQRRRPTGKFLSLLSPISVFFLCKTTISLICKPILSSSSAKPPFLSSANPFLSSPIYVFFLSNFCKPINGDDHQRRRPTGKFLSMDKRRERAGQEAEIERRTGGRGERRERGERCFSIKIMYWVCTVFPYALGNTVETQWTKLNIELLL
jgi:hypothetical protein